MVGGPADNSNVGAVWFFQRTSLSLPFTSLGSKLVGTTGSLLGTSVSLEGAGHTGVAGAPGRNSGVGGITIFSQDVVGSPFVVEGTYAPYPATGATQDAGRRVKMAINGRTLAYSGPLDNSGLGAIWIMTRPYLGSETEWRRQYTSLTPISYTGTPNLGYGFALSDDGRMLLAGYSGSTSNRAIAYAS
jgi:hypothetical protein